MTTTAEDIRHINAAAVQCSCGRMHWDAYGAGTCASCTPLDVMAAAIEVGR